MVELTVEHLEYYIVNNKLSLVPLWCIPKDVLSLFSTFELVSFFTSINFL